MYDIQHMNRLIIRGTLATLAPVMLIDRREYSSINPTPTHTQTRNTEWLPSFWLGKTLALVSLPEKS